MPLALSEIRANATRFAADWRDASSERAEAQTFWNEFFGVFGIRRRSVATFEEKVKNLGAGYDRIDVFYGGVMLGEHKSRGEDLSAATSQAFGYVQSLTREGRDDDLPRYVVVSDFARFSVFDLDSDDPTAAVAAFPLADLPQQVRVFGFLTGYTARPVDPEDPINTRAVEILGALHDTLERGGYGGHTLERFLVRVLFCLFAEDTGIFEPAAFTAMVNESRTDGSDLGSQLARLFTVLDTAPEARPAAMPEELRALPHVNGELFAENLGFADFDAAMRGALLACCHLNWSRISPAVFGSLFQSIMANDAGRRRQIGAHYTSERDIMKLVRSLFLDDLKAELAACGANANRLRAFQDKLASLRFLDPACGCGNFLVVTYRELRLLELEVLQKLYPSRQVEGGAAGAQRVLNLHALIKVDVDQMHGIEIEEWPARIAEVAMWLIDHQMNQKVGEAFGQPVRRLPLKKSAKIAVANALRIDWNEVLPAERCSLVLGNPPFVGAKHLSDEQSKDLELVTEGVRSAGLLDYVCGWYFVASNYIRGTRVQAGFVSTNSITQGEQVGVMWSELFARGVKISFAHRTFEWTSEARGKAHVHVVIIGFAHFDRPAKILSDYPALNGDPVASSVPNISPYLVAGPDVAISNRSTPICESPDMGIGNKPIDDGNYLFAKAERDAFIRQEPHSRRFFRRFFGAEDFIDNVPRWCLKLSDAPPSELRGLPHVMKRVQAVKTFRAASKSAPTRKLAETPTRFHVECAPRGPYLLIPRHSSERRSYIPMGYLGPETLAGDSCLVVPGATLYHFGVLTSAMHMAWVRQVCGRLKSDFRYSNKLVYNSFPWPTDATDRQKAAVEAAAQGVLDARAAFPGQTLADLYDPLTMPTALRAAHKTLDRAVDRCYRAARFGSERARVEYLFELYQRLTSPLLPSAPTPRRRHRPSA